MAQSFLNVIDSFNGVQSVTGPTHVHGHTLDLVLSYDRPVSILVISGPLFLDHMPVLFRIDLSCNKAKPCAATRLSLVLNPSTAGQFSSAFNQNCTIPETVTIKN